MTELRIPPRAEETIFTWGAPPSKFGAGASDEIGFELSQYDVHRVLVLTDPGIMASGVPHCIADSLAHYGMSYESFDSVHVEPTDDSFAKAVGYAASSGRGMRSSPSAGARASTPPKP